MPDPDAPRILLFGAGHSNLLAVQALRAGLPGANITLIDAGAEATYSGMFPGHVAGHYGADALRVDLTRFAARCGIAFRQARITGINPVARTVTLSGDGVMGFDLAALDIGSHSAMPEIAGFARCAVPIKPLDSFATRLIDAHGPVAMIGGGIAGAEIALALNHRLNTSVTLIEAGPQIAATLGPRARGYLMAALDRAGVQVMTNATVAEVTADSVILGDGRQIASALTVGVAGARAHDWLARDLPVDGAGFVRVTPQLQVEGNPTLFATGDCAAMTHAPRPKAGVFAVRQAPILVRNLIAAYHGRAQGRYDPQRDYLKIISLGERRAVAEWRGLCLHGAWLWRCKDRIDRRFMRRLQS